MNILSDLLLEAATYFANLSNPAVLSDSEEALNEVRNFLAIENQIFDLPGVIEELQKLILIPLEPTGMTVNHAMMAGLILARSSNPVAITALLAAACSKDFWCATQGRLNLTWLTPSSENILVLQEEILRQQQLELPEIPMLILIDALLNQGSEDIMPPVLSYLQGDDEPSNLAYILTSLVTLMPEQGLAVAEELETKSDGILSLTALGLRAVYNSEVSYERLLNLVSQRSKPEATGLRWLGRIPRPESLPLLLQGLNRSSDAVRLDLVTSLALFGLKESREAIIHCLSDPSIEVANQSMSLIFDWLGEDLEQFSQHWQFDVEGRLTSKSRYELEGIAENALEMMMSHRRYYRQSLILPEENLEDLYLGFLPGHSWYHWVSTTGFYQPYNIQKNILFNFPVLEVLEDWYLDNKTQFREGLFYYHGKQIIGEN
jgi:hypothetical protein